MTKFKGPAFPSYFNQQTPQSRMQWLSHNGKRQQLRNLRHACAHILKSKDPRDQEQVARVIHITKDEPEPEFGKLHLIFASVDACEQTGEPWFVCMKYMIDKYEDMVRDRQESYAAAQQIERGTALQPSAQSDSR